ncbi:ribosome-binding factor a [Plasmopara halstedii]|uniref:Ribosome-binding factor a n=1 Tax=Plasmopara halstedii TaxID=4781 RepID=A0A0P1B1Y0_PLAHL|nr:ribosome-binding factor a [Plasmopara halstedii]CEG48242.1 ribosome-binding factor a [Plasmopara halstedii]|eukprot:XP_024584611.1 ribosome-binding factor a [Plasmopara halstedii]
MLKCLTVQITLLFYNASLDHSDRPVRVVLWSEILSCLCSHHRISEFHRRHVFKHHYIKFKRFVRGSKGYYDAPVCASAYKAFESYWARLADHLLRQRRSCKAYQSKVLLPPGMIELSNSMELYDDEEVDHDESDQHDEEAEKFLDEAEELFRLNPSDFQKRMDSYNQRHAHEDDDSDDDIDHKVDRAKELIPKEKLAKVMRELNPNSTPTGKNAERMPSTNPRKKNLVHLEKKEKPSRAERTTYRQESVGIAVLEYVQTLLVEDADLSGANIVPTFVEANVSPDLRKIVLFWEPVRLNSEDQIIGKKKAEALKNRLQRQERWVRRNVTQHLNLKYSPVIQFKEQKEAKAEKAQTLFEAEMKWLDNV